MRRLHDLVDGRPMRACLMFAVSAVDTEITTVEGLTNPDGSLGPVQQAFAECHGLQCGFCAGLPHHDHRRPAREPRPTRPADMIAGNLCRCTGYQNIVRSVERAAELARDGGRHTTRAPQPHPGQLEQEDARLRRGHDGAGRMTTKLMGTPVQRVEDQRFLRGLGRYVDDVGVDGDATRRTRPSCAPRTPTRGSSASTSTRSSTSTACTPVWTYEDLTGPMAGAAAAADPAPGAHPRPHAVRPGQGRGELRRRGDRPRRRRRPLHRRGRGRPDQGRLRVPAPVVGIDNARAAKHLVEDVPGNVGARLEQNVGTRRPRSPRPAPAGAGPHHRAQRLHADGGPGHGRALGRRH